MAFYSGQIPQVHKTTHFVFRPLSPEYTEFDYEALMASKGVLRNWSNSTWPTDDFTLDENRADLQRHYEEFQTGKAYAYTVLNPQESRVEGCLYIDPLTRLIERVEKRHGAVRDLAEDVIPNESHLCFWIRSDRLEDEALLFREVHKWLQDAWQFPQVSYGVYHTNPRQAELFESMGMHPRFRMVRDKDVIFSFYSERLPDA